MVVPGIQLHDIPDELIPREPRLGGSCVPIPTSRLMALAHSGSAVLGLHTGHLHAEKFASSVLSELHSLLRLPDDRTCVLVPVTPDVVAEAVAHEGWATHLEVRSRGAASAHWRAGRRSRVEPSAGVGPPPVIGVVAREAHGWLDDIRVAEPGTWTAVDLSRTSCPVARPVIGDIDVAFFCPSWLLGVVPGTTVVAMSPRAVAASDCGPHPTGEHSRWEPGLRALLTPRGLASCGVTATDLMMFGHAVREMAESEPTLLEARIDARLAVVRSWAQDRTWITQEPARPGHDLATALSTSIAPETIRALGAFLEANHVVYGLTGDDRPDAFHIGLYDTIAIEDLTRLLDLLDFVVAATVGR